MCRVQGARRPSREGRGVGGGQSPLGAEGGLGEKTAAASGPAPVSAGRTRCSVSGALGGRRVFPTERSAPRTVMPARRALASP